MNSVGTLEFQHREVEKLFFRVALASDSGMRTQLFKELADRLVAYAAMESQTERASSMVCGRPVKADASAALDRRISRSAA